jgi:hypothetical protein
VSPTEFAHLIARWKWVLLPGLVVALAVGATLFVTGAPKYTRNESYLLLSPVQTEAGPTNPLLNLGNGVTMTASVLAAKVTDAQTVRTLTARQPGLQYTVAMDPSIGAPLLQVSATDTDRAVVDATLKALDTRLSAELDRLQRDTGAPVQSWVTIRKLTADPEATVSHGTPLRNAIGGVLGCGLLALVLVALLERRSRKRAARRAAGAVEPIPATDNPATGTSAGYRPGPPAAGGVTFGRVGADRAAWPEATTGPRSPEPSAVHR